MTDETTPETVEMIREYARLRRGEIGTGDRIMNGEGYAFRVGYNAPDDARAACKVILGSLRELSLLTGLPETSLQIFVDHCRRGANAATRAARPAQQIAGGAQS